MRILIEEEYAKLNNSQLTISGKCNIVNNIIQLKLSEPSLREINRDLSIDIKMYLNSLIEQAEFARIGYDSIEVKKVNEILSGLDLKERLIFIDYFIRQLQKCSFETEIVNFQKLKTRTILKQAISKSNFYKPLNIWLVCIYFPLYNIWSLFLTFIIICFLLAVVLLPAPYEIMECLNVEMNYQIISSNKIFNHFLNVFGLLATLQTDFKIVPKNSLTMILFIATKILAFLYVANFLFNKLGEYLKR